MIDVERAKKFYKSKMSKENNGRTLSVVISHTHPMEWHTEADNEVNDGSSTLLLPVRIPTSVIDAAKYLHTETGDSVNALIQELCLHVFEIGLTKIAIDSIPEDSVEVATEMVKRALSDLQDA